MRELAANHKACKLASGCVEKPSEAFPFPHNHTASLVERERESHLHAKA